MDPMKRYAPLAVVMTAALALSACQKQADAEFGAKVRAYLLEHPEVLEEMALKLREKQTLAAAKASAATVNKYRQQLERDPRDVVINPNGEFTVVEFFDYRCGYCKVVAPEMVKLMQENPDVRFVFKEFPIFGEVSETAARIALTAEGKTKGLQLYKAWMEDRGLDEAALDRHLIEVGLDPAAVRKAAASPAITEQLNDIRTLAQALGLQGTPAFIIGDYVIPGADLDAVKAALAKVKGQNLKRPPATAPGSPT
ncbi:MAG: DsbA family protein [Phenylobacterium sp.]|nr:DsbA family protein [Phenylobacterium sp.]TAL37972.1 MAG: DsbA family protein [Phenylobacterium sp.]